MYWTKHDAAIAWGVTEGWVRRIIRLVPGAVRLNIKGKSAWVVPENSPKPNIQKGVHCTMDKLTRTYSDLFSVRDDELLALSIPANDTDLRLRSHWVGRVFEVSDPSKADTVRADAMYDMDIFIAHNIFSVMHAEIVEKPGTIGWKVYLSFK